MKCNTAVTGYPLTISWFNLSQELQHSQLSVSLSLVQSRMRTGKETKILQQKRGELPYQSFWLFCHPDCKTIKIEREHSGDQ